MELLASFFVALVTLANTIAPQANLPKVLGIETTATASSSSSVWNKAEIEFQQKRQTLADQYKATRAIKEQDFRISLSALKDEKKKAVVANLDSILLARGEKWCTHWSEVGARLDDLLAKVKSRRDKVKLSGKNTSAPDSAIVAAESAVVAAKAAGAVQCAKIYTIQITSGDTGIGQDVKTAVGAFSTDIKSTASAFELARQAIGTAITALTPSATTTATQGGTTR